MSFGPIVSAEWLRQHLGDADLRIVDLRWYLDGRSGQQAYRAGHLPNAVFVDLETELAAPSGPGRHPLPTAEQFSAAMSRAGIGADTKVVVYDDAGGSIAARLWFLLRWFGHPQVAVLDGGLQAWQGELETEERQVRPADFKAAAPDASAVVAFEQLASSRDQVLLDARAPDRYRGEAEPVDPKAGHIPGARSAFWKDNLDSAGKFKPPEALREHYRSLGVRSGADAVLYCGSGVTSCHGLIALELAGLSGARLYPGSWSDWSSRDAPVETGMPAEFAERQT